MDKYEKLLSLVKDLEREKRDLERTNKKLKRENKLLKMKIRNKNG